MKKLAAISLVLAMTAASLAGCGSTANTAAPAESEAAETPAATTEETTDTAADTVAADGKVYNIGICQLVQHEALDAATQGFQDALTKLLGEENVKFDLQNASGDSATCATIVNQFVSSDVDLILANATAPLQAAAAATYATALSIDDWTGVTGTNISGTSDLAPLDQQADMLHELFPDAKNVGILYCSAEANSSYQSNTIQKYLKDYGYECTEYTFADSNDIASVVNNAIATSDVLYIPTDNTAASNTTIIQNICQPAGIPIITGEEGICSGCGVATLSISYYDLGYKTGEMAYEILVNGADVSQTAVEFAPNVTKKYNVANCEALGITVPDDYVAIE